MQAFKKKTWCKFKVMALSSPPPAGTLVNMILLTRAWILEQFQISVSIMKRIFGGTVHPQSCYARGNQICRTWTALVVERFMSWSKTVSWSTILPYVVIIVSCYVHKQQQIMNECSWCRCLQLTSLSLIQLIMIILSRSTT